MLLSGAVGDRARTIREGAAARARGEAPAGFIPTGLREFDARGGLRRGVLTIFGANTGEGKSILALHLATAAAQAGLRVLIFSMEDPVEVTADRILATATGINSARLGNADLNEDEVDRVGIATGEVDWADNVEIHDHLMATGELVRAARETEADLILVDYLQAVREEDSMERTIANLCWDLGVAAQEGNRAVVAFSQVRNQVDERGLRERENHARKNPGAPAYVEGFRPFGAVDLAWCAAAGQRAKELGFLFRPGRYKRRFGEAVKDDVLEISFPKRNFGSEGVIKVGFDGRTARLYNLEKK